MHIKLSTVLLAASASFCSVIQAAPAPAMPDTATLKQIYDTSRSMSGLIAYCVDQSHLKKDSLVQAEKMVDYVSNMPATFDKSSGDAIEKAGRQGKIPGSDGQLMNISDAPQGLEAWCKSADEGLRLGLKSIQQ
ncbi:hypothetical protein [Pseudomonas lundensis]|uniref:hypothetical protein n=1 Tax=Pseudomonas lundensis TaxID=86185 RepID=UPI00385E8B2F